MVFVMHTGGGGGGGRSVRPGSEVEEGKVLSVGWLQGVQQVWPGVRQAPRQCHSSCSRTNSDHAGKHNYTPSTRVHDNVAEIDSTDWSNGKSPSSILFLIPSPSDGFWVTLQILGLPLLSLSPQSDTTKQRQFVLWGAPSISSVVWSTFFYPATTAAQPNLSLLACAVLPPILVSLSALSITNHAPKAT